MSTQLYVYLAAAQLQLDGADGALDSLRMAKALAEQFDQAPDYRGDNLRFVSSNRPATAFDDMGTTAMECILNALETYKSEPLMALWNKIIAGEQQI